MDWKPFAIFKDNTVGSLFLDDSLEREFDRRKNAKLAAELHIS
jgi:hypothetical protein